MLVLSGILCILSGASVKSISFVVPSSKSVACSTEEALKWDKEFENMIDPSGRSVKKIHKDSY